MAFAPLAGIPEGAQFCIISAAYQASSNGMSIAMLIDGATGETIGPSECIFEDLGLAAPSTVTSQAAVLSMTCVAPRSVNGTSVTAALQVQDQQLFAYIPMFNFPTVWLPGLKGSSGSGSGSLWQSCFAMDLPPGLEVDSSAHPPEDLQSHFIVGNLPGAVAAGQQLSFQIAYTGSQDLNETALSQLLVVTVRSDNGSRMATLTSSGAGYLQVTFTTAATGVASYSVAVLVDGQSLQGLPQIVQVLPATLSPADWHVTAANLINGNLTGMVGQDVTVVIAPGLHQPIDQLAGQCSLLEAELYHVPSGTQTELEGAQRLICQPDDASPACLVSINETTAGSYLLRIVQSGVPLGCKQQDATCGALIAVQLLAAAPDQSSTYFVAPASLQVAAGEAVSYGLFMPDLYGNAASTMEVKAQFARSNATALQANITQGEEGWLWATSPPLTIAGSHSISASVEGKAVPSLAGQHTTLTVVPGEPVFNATRISGSAALGRAIAGMSLVLEAELQDLYLNSILNATSLQQLEVQLLLEGQQTGLLNLSVSTVPPVRLVTSFTLYRAGPTTATLLLAGQQALQWDILVEAGPPDIQSTVVVLPEVPIPAGSASRFAVQLQDAWGNPVVQGEQQWDLNGTVLRGPVLLTATANDLRLVVDPGSDSVHFVQFVTEQAGAYTLALVVNGQEVPETASGGSSLGIQVAAGPLDPAATVVTGQGVAGGEAGTKSSFQVVPKDAYGNNWTQGPAALTAAAFLTAQGAAGSGRGASVPIIVSSLADGSYQLGYTTEQAGQVTILLELDGAPIRGSPFHATIAAGPVSPTHCQLSGPDLLGCIAEMTCSFRITSRDSFGNILSGAIDPFFAQSSNASALSLTAAGSGIYMVQYSFPKAAVGVQVMNVSLQTSKGSQLVASFALTITETGAAVSAAYSSAEGPILETALAGQPGNIIISPRDGQGIRQSSDGISYAVLIQTPAEVVPSRHLLASLGVNTSQTLNPDGTVLLQYTVIMAGPYLLSVYMNSSGSLELVGTVSEMAQQSQPFPAALTVLPAAVSPQRSTLSVQAAMLAAGSNVAATLVPLDRFGNQQQYAGRQPGDVVTATAEALNLHLTVPMFANFLTDTGTFTVTAKLTVAGEYEIQVEINAMVVDVLSITVLPSNIDTAFSFVTGPALQGVVAGVTAAFRIFVRDGFNNDIDTRNLSCTLQCQAADQSPAQNISQACTSDMNGTSLTAALYTMAAGYYSVLVQLQQPGRVAVTLGPQTINVSVAEPSAARTRIPGLGNGTLLTAGVVPRPFAVQAEDEFGNAASADCTGYTVALLGPGQNASMTVTATEGSNCSLVFDTDNPILHTPGPWQLQVYLGGSQIQGSPFSLTMQPALADAAASYALSPSGQQLQRCQSPPDCPVYFQGTAGEVNNLTVALIDALGRPYSGNSSIINATLSPFPASLAVSHEASLDAASCGDGIFAIQWTADLATPNNNSMLYQINVTLAANKEAVYGSPFYGKLLPGPENPGNSSVMAVGCPSSAIFQPQLLHQSSPVLQTCFFISTADEFGNAIATADAFANVTAASKATVDLRQMQASDGSPLGQYLAIVGSTEAGSFQVEFEADGEPLAAQKTAEITPGSPVLSNVMVLFGSLDAPYTTTTIGSNVSAVLVGADNYGNLQDLQPSLKGQDFTVAFAMRVNQGTVNNFSASTSLADIATVSAAAGQSEDGNQISSTSQLGIQFSPIRSGVLFLDCSLTINGTSYVARALLKVSAGVAIPSNTLVWGPGLAGGVVRTPSAFYVRAQDSFSNPAGIDCGKIAVKSAASLLGRPSIFPAFDNFTCKVSYTAAAVGTGSLEVLYSGQAVATASGNETVVVASSQIFDANTTFVIPQQPRYVTAGSKVTLFVQLADASGIATNNSWNASVTGVVSGSSAVPVRTLNKDGGSYTLQYTLFKDGDYQVELLANSTRIYGPEPVTCVAGPTSVANTSVEILPSWLEAGKPVTVIITPQDVYGNAQDYVASQLDAVFVTVAGQQFAMPYTAPSFSAILNLTTAGNISLDVWMQPGRLGPRQFVGTYILAVQPSTADPASTQVYGDGAAMANVGTPSTLFVRLMDQNGNPIWDAAEYLASDVTAQLLPVRIADALTSAIVTTGFSAPDRALIGTYEPIVSGPHILQLTVNGSVLAGFQPIIVEPGEIAASYCTIMGLQSSVEVGPISIIISPRDASGTVIRDNRQAAFNVLFKGPQNQNVLVTPSEVQWNGQGYNATTQLSTAGTYQVSVRRGSTHISGSPFQLAVLPGPTAANASVTFGTGLMAAVAGVPADVFVQATDAAGNNQTDAGDRWMLRYNLTGAGVSESMPLTAMGGGLYTASYLFRNIGTQVASVAVLLDNLQGIEHVAVSANVTVLPGAISAKRSTLVPLLNSSYDVSSGSVSAVAGAPTQLLITPFDDHGNVANVTAEDVFVVSVTAVASTGRRLLRTAGNSTVLQVAAITKRQDKRLLAIISPALAGRFVISAAYIPVGGQPVTFARLPISSVPADPDLRASSMSLAKNYTAGSSASFVLHLADRLNNTITEGVPGFVNQSSLQLLLMPALGSMLPPMPVRLPFAIAAAGPQGVTLTFQSNWTGQMAILLAIGDQILIDGSTGLPPRTVIVPAQPQVLEVFATASSYVEAAANYTSYLQLKDAFGNALLTQPQDPLLLSFNDLSYTGSVAFRRSGLFAATFGSNLLIQGVQAFTGQEQTAAVQATVYSGGAQLGSFSVALAQSVGPPDPKHFTVTAIAATADQGDGALPTYTIQAGGQLQFLIITRDANGTLLSQGNASVAASFLVEVAPAVASSQLSIASNDEGTYLLTFSGEAAALHVLRLSFQGFAISELSITVSPGPASPARSYLTSNDGWTAIPANSTLTWQAGLEYSLLVQMADSFGNAALPSFRSSVVQAALISNKTGIVHAIAGQQEERLTFVPQKAGTHQLAAVLDGSTIGQTASIEVTVQHSNFWPAATVLASATSPAIAGQPYEAIFNVFDRFGNAYAAEDLNFVIRAEGLGPPMPLVSGSVDGAPTAGSYAGTFTATAAGNYTVVLLMLVPNGSSAPEYQVVLSFNTTVSAAAVDPLTSLVRGGGLTSAVVGQQATFWVFPRDSFGNPSRELPNVSFPNGTANVAIQSQGDRMQVTYIASEYGQLPVSVNFSIPGGSIGVQNQTYSLLVRPSVAPLLTQASMDSSLATISVGFDQATNEGQMGTSADCMHVLKAATVAKLGSGPSCRFLVPSVLTITLGSQATILPNGTAQPDVISIAPNVIGSAAGNSYNSSGDTPLLGPAASTSLRPTVVITAPVQVGVCESLTVDACQSFGSGGRPLTFTFLLSSPQLQTPELLAQLPRNSQQCSFTLDKDALQPDQAYNVTVQATNFLQYTALGQVTIYKASKVAPTVLIPGGNRTVQQSWEVSLQGTAEYPSAFEYDQTQKVCQAVNSSSRPLTFEWSTDPTGPDFQFQQLPSQYQATRLSAQLTIPGNFLKAGRNYTFLLTATDSGDASVKATAAATVTVQSSPLSVQLLGGDRIVSQNSRIALQALGTDPDNSTDLLGNPLPFIYSWTALGPGGLPLSAGLSTQLFSNAALQQGLVTFASSSLPAGTYTFIVNAVKEPLNSQRAAVAASATLTVVNQTLYEVLVISDSGNPSNFPASMPLQLSCIVSGMLESSLSYAWTVSSFTGLNNISSITSSPNSQQLYIPPGMLSSNLRYTFTCQVVTSQRGFQTGQASLTITTAPVPTSGSLLVERMSASMAAPGYDGIAGLDTFTMIAKDWVGLQGQQLQYEFRYMQAQNGSSSPEQPLAVPTLSNSINTRLPAGQVTIVLYVRYFDSAATSPLGLPAGARLQSRVLSIQPLINAQTPGRRLLQGGSSGAYSPAGAPIAAGGINPVQAVALLEAVFDEAVANGDVSTALSVASIFSQTFDVAGASASLCTADGPSTAARERILATMLRLDAVTYSSSTYILQASCAFAAMASMPLDLTLAAAETVVSFLAAHIAGLQNEYAAAAVAPLPNGDPYKCFATGLSGAMSRLGALCSSNTSDSSIVAALQALPGLGLSVATTYPVGSSPWGYNLSSFLIQAADDLSQVSAQAGNVSLTAHSAAAAVLPPSPTAALLTTQGPTLSPLSADTAASPTNSGPDSPSSAFGSTSAAAAEAGVVIQLLGLRPNNTDGSRVASDLVGAYTSSGAASTLLFTLPNAIPQGATFQLAQFLAGAGASGRRRLMAELPQPVIVSENEVSVELPAAGYYYLTGGDAPIVTAASGTPRNSGATLRRVKQGFITTGGVLAGLTALALCVLLVYRRKQKLRQTVYPAANSQAADANCDDIDTDSSCSDTDSNPDIWTEQTEF